MFHQRLHDGELLPHTQRIRFHLGVGMIQQIEQSQQPFRFLLIEILIDTGQIFQILHTGFRQHESRILNNHTHGVRQLPIEHDRLAVHGHHARIQPDEPADRTQQHGLARTVRPHHAVDSSTFEPGADIPQHLLVLDGLRRMIDGDVHDVLLTKRL